MKPCAFDYHDPATVKDAVALLANNENARILAGGQSLMPMMNFRYVQPDALIDINGIAELDGIRLKPGAIEIGAMTRQRTLEFSDDIRIHCPLMAEVLPNIGHRQTRNRGTIGGSLAHADPAAELPMIALSLDATIEAQSVRGSRTVPMAEFSRGYMMTALAPDEMLTKITLPLWPREHGFAFVEFARRRGDFAMAASAVLIVLDARDVVRRVSLTVAGLGATPVRLKDAEQAMMGQAITPALITEAANTASNVETTSDIHAGADYRRHLGRVLTARALVAAVSRARERREKAGHG